MVFLFFLFFFPPAVQNTPNYLRAIFEPIKVVFLACKTGFVLSCMRLREAFWSAIPNRILLKAVWGGPSPTPSMLSFRGQLVGRSCSQGSAWRELAGDTHRRDSQCQLE